MAPIIRGLSLLRLHQPLADGATPALRRFWGTLTETSSTKPELKHEERILRKIMKDVQPLSALAKYILKSYLDGGVLEAEDEKAVTEKLLVYHLHYEDKIGSGLSCIMVDRSREYGYRRSRSFFVVRTDGECEAFSYKKCLQSYIRAKYPSYAESFFRNHRKLCFHS